MSDSYKETYCVFEGGGAIGVCHVGFLKALEEYADANALEVEGYAGSSAGALVALLAAAGVSADEMIGELDARGLDSILRRLEHPDGGTIDTASRMIDLDALKPPATWKLWAAEIGWRLANGVGFTRLIVGGFAAAAALAAIMPIALLGVFHGYEDPSSFVRSISLIMLIVAAAMIFMIYRVGTEVIAGGRRMTQFAQTSVADFRGLTDLNAVETALRQFLAAKLKVALEEPIPFQRFEEITGKKLKVVAANLDRERMELFSRQTTPNACVVDATIASMSIPLIFEPKTFSWPTKSGTDGREQSFVDGGLVSNVPAWSFEPELRLNRNALIIASLIGSEVRQDQQAANASLYNYAKSVLRTAIFGGVFLNTRGLDRFIAINANPGVLDVLDFGAPARRIAAAKNLAYLIAKDRFSEEQYLNDYVDAVRAFAMTEVHNQIDGRNLEDHEFIRAAIAIEGDFFGVLAPYFKLRFCKGFESFPDERAVYPVEDSLFGQAISEGEAIFADLSDDDTQEWFRRLGVDGWAEKLTPRDLRWAVCVPAELGRVRPGVARQAVITVDSNVALSGQHLQSCVDAIVDYINQLDVDDSNHGG